MADGDPFQFDAVGERLVSFELHDHGGAVQLDVLVRVTEPILGAAPVVSKVVPLDVVDGQHVARAGVAVHEALVDVDGLAVLGPRHLRSRFSVHHTRQLRVVTFGDADEGLLHFDFWWV